MRNEDFFILRAVQACARFAKTYQRVYGGPTSKPEEITRLVELEKEIIELGLKIAEKQLRYCKRCSDLTGRPVFKPASEFHKTRLSWCKQCYKEYSRKYRDPNGRKQTGSI